MIRGWVRIWKDGGWNDHRLAPRPGNFYDVLRAAWGVSDANFYVVGNKDGSPNDGIVWHFENGVWTEETPKPGLPRLSGIWGTTDDRIYVVGGFGTILEKTLQGWSTSVETPDKTATLTQISGIERDAVVVGSNGAVWRIAPP